jgi:hypothetical protein
VRCAISEIFLLLYHGNLCLNRLTEHNQGRFPQILCDNLIIYLRQSYRSIIHLTFAIASLVKFPLDHGRIPAQRLLQPHC